MRDLVARALVLCRGDLRQRVDAPVDVRVLGLVERAQLVEDLPRLVGADGRVEIGERLASDLLLEDRKVGAQLARIEPRLGLHSHQLTVPGGYGWKRTVAPMAEAFVSVTRQESGIL